VPPVPSAAQSTDCALAFWSPAVSGHQRQPVHQVRFLISKSVSTRFFGSSDLSLILRTHWLSSLFHLWQKALCWERNIFFADKVWATKLTFEINCKWVRIVFYLCPGQGVGNNTCIGIEHGHRCACVHTHTHTHTHTASAQYAFPLWFFAFLYTCLVLFWDR
jgi:hypothetical protein